MKTSKGIIDVTLVKENKRTLILQTDKKQIKIKKSDPRLLVGRSEQGEESHNAD
jgi:RNase P/RNase MRP subunit p29